MIIRRLLQLFAGLTAYGFATALMIRSGLGLNPWDVFHQGLDERTSLSFGTVVILAGVFVLLLWIPLRQRPGLGTISNVILIGLSADAALAMLPVVEDLLVRAALLVTGILLLGVATSAYIGAGLGPGPRDGLMTGLAARTGWSISLVRTSIEIGVLAIGWWLGGQVGLGTLLFALSIGPIIEATLPYFRVPDPPPCRRGGAKRPGRRRGRASGRPRPR
jgi:uncharacterized membrane protein YczE